MLIIFNFPYNFFFTSSLSAHSERLTAFKDNSSLKFPCPAGLVLGWETLKYTTCRHKNRTEYAILMLENCEPSNVQILFSLLYAKQILLQK